jgi:8-oxo-dGTP pyrophosphatase MutT (NUDIX family)
MSSVNHIPSCAGVVVLRKNKDIDELECVIVKAGESNYGFPKGKTKGKKDKRESYKETALRELEEETGIQDPQIKFINNNFIDEINEKGNVNIKYLTAEYIDPNEHVFTYDKNELENVKWMLVTDALKVLWDRRKTVLEQAVEMFNTVLQVNLPCNN